MSVESTQELQDLISYVTLATAATDETEELLYDDSLEESQHVRANEAEMDTEDRTQLVLRMFPPNSLSNAPSSSFLDAEEELEALKQRHAALLQFARKVQVAREAERQAFHEELRLRSMAMQTRNDQGQARLRELVQTFATAKEAHAVRDETGEAVLSYLCNHRGLLTDIHRDILDEQPDGKRNGRNASSASDRKEIHRLRTLLETSLKKQKQLSESAALRETALKRKLGISDKSLVVTLKRVDGLRRQLRSKEDELMHSRKYIRDLEAKLLSTAKQELRMQHAQQVVKRNNR